MRHPSEEELVLHYYGECGDPEWVRAHLARCPECREMFEELTQVLALTASEPVPERDGEYGTTVWSRLEPRLPGPRRTGFRLPAWIGAAAAIATVLLIMLQPAPEKVVQPEISGGLNRDAILRMELVNHLDQSERFLMEALNSGGALEAEWAEDLLHSNRLLRQAAEGHGMTDAGGVLEELELALTESAHPNDDGEILHFDGPEVLFRVRAVQARLVDREVFYASAF